MLRKKKEINSKNFLLDNKRNELICIGNRLYEQVKKIIIKQAVINIYPSGADQDRAKKDLEQTKQHLLCIIGEYDDKRQQYQELKKKYPEYKGVDFPSSHDQIETDYIILKLS